MRVPQLRLSCAVLVLLIAALAPPVGAGPRSDKQPRQDEWRRKLDTEIRRKVEKDSAPVRVIVRTRPGAASAVERDLTRRSRKAKRFGLSMVGGVATEVDRSDLQKLAENPDVEHISIDAPVRSHQTAAPCSTLFGNGLNDPCTKPQSQFYVLRGALGTKNSSWTGANIGVGIVDSGISLSGDPTLPVTAFYDFTSGSPVQRSAIDSYGHGTHIAGLIANTGRYSESHYQGVATGVRLIGLRVLDGNGGGMTSHVIQAIEFAVANRTSLGIDVLNLSLGHPVYESAASDPLVLAVESAVRAGIVVVVSAGNRGINPATGQPGYGGISSPGNAPSAITVGSVDLKGTAGRHDDAVAPYSSRGPSYIDNFAKPDIVAPGHRLGAPMHTGAKLYADLPQLRLSPVNSLLSTKKHLRLSGTSMATGIASGVVATMLQASRATFGTKLTPNAVKAMLQYSAIPLAGVDPLIQGAGSLNAAGALELAVRANPAAVSGSWWLTSNTTDGTSIEGTYYNWSQSIVWNNHVVWGDSIKYNQSAWATHVVWGDTVANLGGTAVQGNHVVWGDTATWANHVVWGDSVNGNHVVWGDSSVDGNHVVWGDSFQERDEMSDAPLTDPVDALLPDPDPLLPPLF